MISGFTQNEKLSTITAIKYYLRENPDLPDKDRQACFAVLRKMEETALSADET
jgi:hypothetical protein